MNNIAIIYHDADFDGKLSNEVCRLHLARLFPNAAIHSYGWDYGRPVPEPTEWPLADNGAIAAADWVHYDAIYIVDLSVDELMARPELRDKIVWIDHHKSAIEKWDFPYTMPHTEHLHGRGFKGYRIDGVAACRLCWNYFTWDAGVFGEPAKKDDFINRTVVEPRLIRLAGEYDIWDHRDPDAKALQFGLRCLHEEKLRVLVHGQFEDCGDAGSLLRSTIETGYAIKSYCDKQADEYSAAYACTLDWEGLKFCALNIGQRGNSDLLRGGLKPEHQACFAWRHDGEKVLVSLYHAPGHEDIDLSKIAVKYGGGGHKGACGFRIGLTFLNEILNPNPA